MVTQAFGFGKWVIDGTPGHQVNPQPVHAGLGYTSTQHSLPNTIRVGMGWVSVLSDTRRRGSWIQPDTFDGLSGVGHSCMGFSARHRFAEWPDGGVPDVAAGVYAIWEDSQLIYCGMSGRGIEQARESGKRKYGLTTRLNSHASGRLSGDQFCVYVANRLVLPSLNPRDLPRFADGTLTLDRLTRDYIRERLDYQYMLVDSSSEAFRVEKQARSGQPFGQKPTLNPLT